MTTTTECRELRVRITPENHAKLEARAKAKNCRLSVYASKILNVVIEEDLFNAILDDEQNEVVS